jgi:hypothetical protein
MKAFLAALLLASTVSQDKPPRALDLLDESGQQYEKSGSGWSVKFTGNNLKQVSIYVAQPGEMIVLAALLANKADVQDASGLQAILLRANEDYDYIKTTIDDDGDYMIRLDLLALGLTGKRLSEHLVQIATVVDLLEPSVSKFRKKK